MDKDDDYDYDEEFEIEEEFEDEENIEDEEDDLETDEKEEDATEIIEDGSFQPSQANKNRITSKYLNKYERVKIIGIRAQQISYGALPLVDIGNLTDPMDIAMLELKEKKIPFIIKRYLPNGTFELWNLNELLFVDDNF
jgi:DNA-directed RNA polymerase I, II, and III subunit RPABC2